MAFAILFDLMAKELLMILAHQNGTIIPVTMIRSTEKSTVVQDLHEPAKFTIKVGEEKRKLFDGSNPVDDAIAWIKTHQDARKLAATKAKYPLEIENVGGDVFMVMSRGHHDATEFMVAVRDAGYNWPLGNPKQVWCKSVPNSVDGCGVIYAFVDKGSKGSWPATISSEAYDDEQYVAPASQSA